ncbi:MAG: hypothetical protein J3K34DRAFT_367180 [Monoraphidium minutum]|nr:MAG: hypothetical protein J3K34DRAFT_367180 [Monoraphidium minutum]
MVKGNPLSFLNKKGWHPGSFKNTEKVWKKEQEAAEEQRKLEELQKQMEDERRANEYVEIAASAGHKRQDGQLDWMYRGQARGGVLSMAEAAAGGGIGTGEAAPADEQPLCKPVAPEENLSRAERAAMAPSLFKADAAVGATEAWQRLNNDPMLMIRKREQEQLKQIKSNPIKMQEIWSEVRPEGGRGRGLSFGSGGRCMWHGSRFDQGALFGSCPGSAAGASEARRGGDGRVVRRPAPTAFSWGTI